MVRRLCVCLLLAAAALAQDPNEEIRQARQTLEEFLKIGDELVRQGKHEAALKTYREAAKAYDAAMRKIEVNTYIPRFKLTETMQLNAALSSLGMPSAFAPNKADFAGMNGKRNLFISAALHKAFVDVNEEGTEAAAATGIVVGVTSLPPRPKVFRADHPFVFLIRDQQSGSILFIGRMVNPKG